jgi:electron transfer flavoprotein alpha/beta subunit
VTRAVGLEHDGERLAVRQALPGGRRRILEATAPLVLVVGPGAPPAPLCALGPALRGTVNVQPSPVSAPADDAHDWPRRPARHRPRRLAPHGGGEREARRELVGADPVAAADAILDFLERESLLNPAVASHERA